MRKNRSSLPNDEYWALRSNERMDIYMKNCESVINRVDRAYIKAIDDINKDIKKIFGKFIDETGLSEEEAKKFLNGMISIKVMDDIYARINLIEDIRIRDRIKKVIHSTRSFKARITRLEAVKESARVNMARVADVQLRDMDKLFIDNINEAYYRSIYDLQQGINVGFSFDKIPTDRIEEILKNNWSGINYSDRVWINTTVLADKVQDVLISGFTSGKSYKKMAKELEGLTDMGKYATRRLVRTEMCAMANRAEMEGYKEVGIDKYVFVATLDSRTSIQCQKLDGKIFNAKDAKQGTNYPPMHPNCRSTTIAYMGEDWLKGIKRRARDPKTGKTYIINNMSYEEWYKKYVSANKK